jgi:hypothetical protein
MSHIPLWLAPSSPVTPARSSTMVTPALCSRRVHEDLIERAVQEGRVDGDHRVQPTHRHPHRRGDGVLFRDAHIEDALRVHLLHRRQTCGAEHGGGDRHDVRALRGDVAHLFGEHRRPGRGRLTGGTPGGRVDHTHAVEAIGLVLLRRRIAPALLRQHVHKNRPRVTLGPAQCLLHRHAIVSRHRTEVLQPQVLEHALGRDDILDALLQAVQGLEGRAADDRGAVQHPAAPLQEPLVPLRGPQGGEVVGQPADRRVVAALVVVDHDHHRAVGSSDVVQGLPRHATGQSTVTDDRHDVPAAEHSSRFPRLGQTIGVGQRGTCV